MVARCHAKFERAKAHGAGYGAGGREKACQYGDRLFPGGHGRAEAGDVTTKQHVNGKHCGGVFVQAGPVFDHIGQAKQAFVKVYES
jgi:hypothetical protein